MTPIKLKLALYLKRKGTTVRDIVALTAKPTRSESVGRTKLSDILNGKPCTAAQKITVAVAARKLGMKATDIFHPCTPAEIDEIESYSRNGHKNYGDKIPGYKPVALRAFRQWGITAEQLKCALHYPTRAINALLFKGPAPGNEKLRADIENYLARKNYPIRTGNLWEKMEEHMDGQRLLDDTIEKFGITNDRAFLPRIDPENVFEWPAFSTFKKRLKNEMERQGTAAVIGPSGSGKSTMVNNTIYKHFSRKNSPYRIIRPEGVDVPKYTINHLLEALCHNAGDALKTGSHEARSRQTKAALIGLCKSGVRPIMVIEDAHLLDVNVILMFKRIMEWEDAEGRPALGIVLVCQEEMDQKMGPRVRQFWTRTQVIKFPYLVPTAPEDRRDRKKLTLKHLTGYIKFRLHEAGLDHIRVFDSGCLDEAAKHLAGQTMDLPLIVNNFLIAAMNEAAMNVTKSPKIDRQIIEMINLTRAA